MELRRITQDLAVAPQIAPADMARLAGLGFVAIICNRPDGEDAGQPTAEIMRAAANEAGLAFHFLPVSGGAFSQATLDQFRAIRREATGPVLAYCRSGTRSITLETLANPDGASVEERIERAAAAGYDLGALAGQLGP